MLSNKMGFILSETAHPGAVALKVADLKKVTLFYQEIIGLTVLEVSDKESILGVANTPLLILTLVEEPLPAAKKTGLYHVAFLLPERKDLGNALFHYLSVEAPIIGASDHGYSEAIYLNDPEGNGIEVYWDKPKNEWDIRSDGEIVGITIEMDAAGVIAAADRNWQGFPKGTKIGHVHLKVANLSETEKFYTEVLGLSLKTNYGNQAKFFATGEYHHHIGTNSWESRNAQAMSKNDLGLNYFNFLVADLDELQRIEQHWQTLAVAYNKDVEGNLWIMDPNGITIKWLVEV